MCERTLRILQRVELAFMGGNGHFLRAQCGLRLLQCRLQFGLLALQSAFATADLHDLVLNADEHRLEFGNLILAGQDGIGRFGRAIRVTAGINTVAAE